MYVRISEYFNVQLTEIYEYLKCLGLYIYNKIKDSAVIIFNYSYVRATLYSATIIFSMESFSMLSDVR